MLCKDLINFAMPWDRLFLARFWIYIKIVDDLRDAQAHTLRIRFFSANLFFSYIHGKFFDFMLCRDIIKGHQCISISHIFLKFCQCLSLCHYFRMFEEFSDPELFAFLMNHFSFVSILQPPKAWSFFNRISHVVNIGNIFYNLAAG